MDQTPGRGTILDESLTVKNQIMSNPSELDWFTFETKIRKVVADLMEPSIKR